MLFPQGDAVLSYRDGQSIVEVTVRSMDAKQYVVRGNVL